MPTLRLTLHPLGNERFAVLRPDGTELLRSRVPIYETGRRVPPDTYLEFVHEGSTIVAMRGLASELAKWTVTERDRGGLSRVRYQPHPRTLLAAE